MIGKANPRGKKRTKTVKSSLKYPKVLTRAVVPQGGPVPKRVALLHLAASVAATALPSVAASLLVIPGLWLLTRWSLFAPSIVREGLGPLAALRRSNELVRGHFEMVFLTAAFAVILEEALLGAGAFVGLMASGSETWGEWAGGSVAAVVILPLASFATALTYSYLMRNP